MNIGVFQLIKRIVEENVGNLKLKHKFMALGAAWVAMFIALAVFCIVESSTVMEDVKMDVGDVISAIDVQKRMGSITTSYLKEITSAKNVWLRGSNTDNVAKYRAEFIGHAQDFDTESRAMLDGLKFLTQRDAAFSGFIFELNAIIQQHENVNRQYIAQIDRHKSAAESDAQVNGIDRALTNQLKEFRANFVKFMSDKNVKMVADEEKNHIGSIYTIIIWVAVSLAINMFFGWYVERSVLRQLGGDPKDVAQVVNAMANGDFTFCHETNSTPNSLLANACAMQEQLRKTITEIKANAERVGEMASELAMSASQIAENVHHESDAVSGLAASIEELSASTLSISEQGGNAKSIAGKSCAKADDGSAIIKRTAQSLLEAAQLIEITSSDVSKLGETAIRINEVVSSIKEIADQTNLLALNAAIEAARAGEQGRGFAVVADEVRKLADRTTLATRDIKLMAEQITDVAGHALGGMKKVVSTTREGSVDAGIAQNAISGIQQSFGEVSRMVDDISVSLVEQNGATSNLSKNTERVASMAEENSSSARCLLEMAASLSHNALMVKNAVGGFKV